jgi:hypothetical protein
LLRLFICKANSKLIVSLQKENKTCGVARRAEINSSRKVQRADVGTEIKILNWM